MSATCPRCGCQIPIPELPRPKGMGKKTGAEQECISEKQVWTLKVLERLGAYEKKEGKTRQQIFEEMRDEAVATKTRIPSSHIVGFWLSALLGAGFVSMENAQIEVMDYKTREFRFIRKPIWYMSASYLDGVVSYDLETRRIVRHGVGN